MKLFGNILNNEEKERIHEESLRVLEETGIIFSSEKALALLEENGAKVDWDSKTAYIGRELVEKTLKTTPKEFTLGARNPKYDFTMPSNFTTFTVDGTGVNTLEYESGKKRDSTLEDVINTAKIYEKIDMGQIYWPPVEPIDVDENSRYFVGVCHSYINCSKHIQGEVRTVAEVEYTVKVLKEILGDEKNIIERKIYSGSYCPVAPLTHDKKMLEANMELTKYKAPILIYPMPACGTTGPMTLFSNLIVSNAEALSSIVLFQLTTPGTPLIYGSALGTVNMKNGLYIFGAPETSLMLMATGEMGKYYNMPTIIAGSVTDAKMPGIQCAMEKCLTSIPHMIAHVDAIQGIGMFESSMTLSLEQLIIDGEMASLCNRLVEGINSSEDRVLFEDINEVGPGSHYLMQASTRKFLKTDEFYLPGDIVTRGSTKEWENKGSLDMYDKAHERVLQTITSDIIHPLKDEQVKTILEIVEDAKAKM